jgi:hypothetical protein
MGQAPFPAAPFIVHPCTVFASAAKLEIIGKFESKGELNEMQKRAIFVRWGSW